MRWEEKEVREGSLAGNSTERKALGWKGCSGDAVLEGQTEPEPGQVPTSCSGWANITNSSSSFCIGRAVHNEFIIVLKTKQSNPAFDCDHSPDLHNSWVSKLYGLLALCRLYLKSTKKKEKKSTGNGKNLAINRFVGKVTPLSFPSFPLLL